jgi:hypothetical protein
MAEPKALKLLADAGPNLNKDKINSLTHCLHMYAYMMNVGAQQYD